MREEAAAQDAEEKAERAARKEVAQVPVEQGVYLIEEGRKLTPIKAGESKIVTNKRRSVLKALSPIPLVPGKATLELDGPHALAGTANREPEFYIRLSADERFGIVRMGEHKGNRVVEKLTIIPVIEGNVRRTGPGGDLSQASGRSAFQDLARRSRSSQASTRWWNTPKAK